MTEQINQNYLLEEITKQEILLNLLRIVDVMKHDSQATDEDVIESIMELIVKTDLAPRTNMRKIWRDCP